MDITSVKHTMKMQRWAEMVRARQESGMSIKAWCQDNGITSKTYYYRLNRIRQEALKKAGDGPGLLTDSASAVPVFAELWPGGNSCAEYPGNIGQCVLTVRVGEVAIDIQNAANAEIVAKVLRAVRDIC